MSKQKKRLNELGKMKANQVSGPVKSFIMNRDELLEFCRLSQKEKTKENSNDIAITLLETEIAIYMRKETKLSPKSIKNYTQACRKIARDLKRDPNDINTRKTDLRTCKSSELEKLFHEYFLIPEYRNLNEKGKGMYKAASKHGFRCRVYQERLQKNWNIGLEKERNDLLKTKILKGDIMSKQKKTTEQIEKEKIEKAKACKKALVKKGVEEHGMKKEWLEDHVEFIVV